MIRHTIYPTLPVGALYSFDQLPELLQQENVTLSDESTEEFLFTCLTACLPKSRALKVLSHMVSKGILVYKENVEYDVETILDDDYDIDEQKMYYYVKWIGWPLAFCTWEPEDNFVSDEVIEAYKKCKKSKVIPRYIDDDISIPELLSRLRSCVNSYVTTPAVIVQSIRDALKYKGRWKNNENGDSADQFEMPFRPKPRLPTGKLGINSRKIRRRAMPGPRSKAYQALREKSQRALKEWEKEINAAVGGKEARIYVENNVDLEGPPADFKYITDYYPGKGVEINNEPVVGCACTDCYADRKTTCCSAMAVGSVPYSTARRLRLDPGEPIYECNKLCGCGDDCPFRVVQRGRQVKLTIYRTHNRGWGIKAVNKIKKGTFVMEYVGEVITCEEAETRGRQYDEEAMTYLFDLDFVGDPLYSVDARYMGNISHFVNHSCDPNLSTHCVYVDCMDLYLPRLALFAIRDVNAGEELSFDYRMTGIVAESHKSLNASGIVRALSPSDPLKPTIGLVRSPNDPHRRSSHAGSDKAQSPNDPLRCVPSLGIVRNKFPIESLALTNGNAGDTSRNLSNSNLMDTSEHDEPNHCLKVPEFVNALSPSRAMLGASEKSPTIVDPSTVETSVLMDTASIIMAQTQNEELHVPADRTKSASDAKDCEPERIPILSKSPLKEVNGNTLLDGVASSNAAVNGADEPQKVSEERSEVNEVNEVNFDKLSNNSSFERGSKTASETSVPRGRMKCLCGSKNCRGYLY